MNQIGLLLRLYVSPLRTFSRIIDEGRLIFAVVAALITVLALQIPRNAEYQRQAAEVYARLGAGSPVLPGPPPIHVAVEQFTARAPMHYFPALAALALCFVPAAILILTLWDALGACSTILFRDYLTLLVCSLLAWAAAYLPLALITAAQLYFHLPGYDHPALWWWAQLHFLTLTVCAMRTVFGTGFGHASGAAAGAWTAAVGGLWLHSLFGGVTSWLASPFVLYYLYYRLQPDFRSLGVGLWSRQRLKQHLEIATLNPRDADAHYQLGLIYQQRRQYAPAIERFQKTLAIDPAEPDAHYQLGRIARQQGRYADALEHYRAAARIDDRHCASEVWREIGIVNLLTARYDEARAALEKYLDRRPYDPEGQCWHGRVLVKLGLQDAAERAFNQAIEAVRTMPAARKRQVRAWAAEASKELRGLRTSRRRAATSSRLL